MIVYRVINHKSQCTKINIKRRIKTMESIIENKSDLLKLESELISDVKKKILAGEELDYYELSHLSQVGYTKYYEDLTDDVFLPAETIVKLGDTWYTFEWVRSLDQFTQDDIFGDQPQEISTDEIFGL